MIEGVPLRDALNLPALDGARVLAGATGLGRRVRYVNVMEVPDILDWVKPDELLLTTAYPLRDDDTLGAYTVLHTFGQDARGVQRGVDGMCLDTDGNIIACAGWRESGPGPMIYVFAPSGRVLETHPVPVDRPTNCTFVVASSCRKQSGGRLSIYLRTGLHRRSSDLHSCPNPLLVE